MKVIIISGARNSSKTTTLKRLLSSSENKFLGYICENSDNKKKLYLRNLLDNKKIDILQTDEIINSERIGRYYIIPNSFEESRKVLLDQIEKIKEEDFIVVLDEIGALELSGSGYDALIKDLIKINKDLIICVRDTFVEDVCEKYKFNDVEIINVNK
ncbi:MAG: nucleoside-triphosphatase [Pleomorphochaeta sp.]